MTDVVGEAPTAVDTSRPNGGDHSNSQPASNPDLSWWALIATVLLLALFGVGAAISNTPNKGVAGAAAALVLISAVAVGIERILEVFWTFIDSTKGTFWPLTAVDSAINGFAAQISNVTSGPLGKLKDSLDEVKKDADWTDKQVAGAKQQIDELSQKLAQLTKLAPNSDNAKLIVAVATVGLKDIATRYPKIKSNVDQANEAVTAVDAFVDSLTDNPGRRIISIYLGMLFGLIVAVVLALDVFNATLGTVLQSDIPGLDGLTFKWGVVVTGLVMGLGSNPTHEVIKALQAYKQGQQAA